MNAPARARLVRYTGEAAGVEPDPRRPGKSRYVWDRTWLVLGKYVTITRHGKAAGRAHARLMVESEPWS